MPLISLFKSLNLVTKKSKITYITQIIFLLGGAILEAFLSGDDLNVDVRHAGIRSDLA